MGLIERGLRSPSLETLSKMAEIFNLPETFLLYNEEKNDEIDAKIEHLLSLLKKRSSQEINMIIKIVSSIFE